MKSSMLFVLPVLFLVQKVDFTDPDNVFKAQLLFGVVQSLVILLCVHIYLQINKSNNQTQIAVPPTPSPFSAPAAAPPPQQMTVKEYDILQLRKFAQQIVIGVCIAIFLFAKWDIVPPLAIQCVLNPVNLYGSPLFKLYVLGAPQASHPRPFPEENPLAGLLPTAPADPEPIANNEADTEPTKDTKKESKESKQSKQD